MFASGISRSLAALALLCAILAASSCSDKVTSADELSIDVRITAAPGTSWAASQASAFVLTVTGPGIIAPIVADLALSGGTLVGSVMVPAGPDRLFHIDAFDAAGALLFSGETTADVVGGTELALDIALVPQVPMIKVSPTYLETLQGDVLAMKIRVYKLPDITGIHVSLASHRSVGGTYLDVNTGNVVIDPQLAKVAGAAISLDGSYTVHIDVSLRNLADRIVDADGYVEIATVSYQTHLYEVSPFETAVFTPAVVSMTDRAGAALPTEGIRAENSVVLLYDPRARYVAYWNMSTGDVFANIYDQSGNGLDGTATGTTNEPYGPAGQARLFNGTGDFIEVPDDALLDLSNEITISMWIYLPAAAAPNPLSSLICKRDADGAVNYQLLLEDVSGTDGFKSFLFKYGGSLRHTYRVDIADSWRTQGWFHVLFSYRFGEPSSAMFVLGQGCFIDVMPGEWIAGDGRGAAPNTSGALYMGKDNASAPAYVAGGLDEVELYDIAWTWGAAFNYLFTGCR
jgi:hypothetical protein